MKIIRLVNKSAKHIPTTVNNYFISKKVFSHKRTLRIHYQALLFQQFTISGVREASVLKRKITFFVIFILFWHASWQFSSKSLLYKLKHRIYLQLNSLRCYLIKPRKQGFMLSHIRDKICNFKEVPTSSSSNLIWVLFTMELVKTNVKARQSLLNWLPGSKERFH